MQIVKCKLQIEGEQVDRSLFDGKNASLSDPGLFMSPDIREGLFDTNPTRERGGATSPLRLRFGLVCAHEYSGVTRLSQ